MTIDFKLQTVTAAIAALNIGDITVKDIDAIPDSARLLCPLIIPNPNNFLTSITFTRASMGGAGSALMDSSYVLNYIYLHCEARSGIDNYASYNGLMTNLSLILEAIFGNDDINGAVDMVLDGVDRVDYIKDPAGIEYLGVMFRLKITEFVQ